MSIKEDTAPFGFQGENLERIDMLANVSHEIRNPLHAIIGISHLLGTASSKEEQEEYLKALTQTSESLLEIANNLMDFSKMKSGRLRFDSRPVNLKKRIPENLVGLKIIAESKDLEFDVHLDEEIPDLLETDPIKLRQVLINLISNAIKFTTRGSVTLWVKNLEKTASEAVLEFSVKDTGVGISKENQEKIFKPFDQGDEKINTVYGGTGLGLTISKRILEMMGSTLKVKSTPGEGSEFSFELKLKIKREVSQKSGGKEVEVVRKDLNVLVVDDNKLNRMVAQRSLRQWDIGSQMAGNGEEALDLLKDDNFDLVLLDLRMPVMDGYETVKRIRSLASDKLKNLPIIALTGSLSLKEQEELMLSGFSDYLLKPYRSEELYKKILFLFPGE